MRRLRIPLFLLLAILLLGVFAGVTVSAEPPTDFEYVIGSPDGPHTTLNCYPLETEPPTLRVEIKDFSTADAETMDLAIPDVISYDGVDYTVTALGALGGINPIPSDLASVLNTLTVGEHMQTIYGNLFSWKNEAYQPVNNTKLCSTSVTGPDTPTTLACIPSFISSHYNDATGHAYYAGKCLVRLDPAYSGDFTVRDGTICILASAFEGCASVQKVTIPDSVEFIGVRAFTNSGVTEVNLPAGLSEHSNELFCFTFWHCGSLKTVSTDRLTAPLSQIGMGCFTECGALTGFDFSKANYIEYLAFNDAFDPEAEVAVSLKPNQLSYGGGAKFAGSGIASLEVLEDAEVSAPMIQTECFRNCAYLTSVDLGPVQSIYASAFEGCTALATDPMAAEDCAVRYLDFRCFANTGLTEVTIPANVSSTSGGIFADNPSLLTLNWKPGSGYFNPLFAILNDCSQGSSAPYAVRTALGSNDGEYLPEPEKNGHTFIKTLNVYGAVPDAKMSAYLEEVHILNEDLTQIPSNRFEFCPSLKTVSFAKPEAITLIGDEAFAFCPSLNSFPFPEMTGLQYIGTRSFMLDDYGGFYSKAEREAFGETDFRTGIGLQGTVDLSGCSSLTTIGNYAFQCQLNVTELDLPASLQGFGNDFAPATFGGMPSLKTLKIYGPLTAFSQGMNYIFSAKYGAVGTPNYVGYNVYTANDAIETIYAPNAGIIPASSSFFSSFTALKQVTLGGTEHIHNSCFVNCIELEEVHLPDALTLEEAAFFGDGKLRVADMPKLEVVGAKAFISCGIRELSLPAVKTACWNSFFGCKDLEHVSLPNLETIETYAAYNSYSSDVSIANESNLFMNCEKLQWVDLGKVTALPDNTFMKSGLQAICLPAEVEYSRHLLDSCPKLETLIVAEGNTELANFLCASCPNLQTVVLPESLKTVNWGAFKNSGAFTVVLPEGLETIEDDAFAGSSARIVVSKWDFEILADHEADPKETWTDPNAESLKAIGPDCIIYYTDDPDQPGSVKEKAEAWIDQNYEADEPRPAVLPLPEDAVLTLEYDEPAVVEQGQPLPEDFLRVCFDGVELTPEQYSLDYDPADETLGHRVVNVTATELTLAAGKLDLPVEAFDIFGETVSETAYSIEMPSVPRADFDLWVYTWGEPAYSWDETNKTCTAERIAMQGEDQPLEVPYSETETVEAAGDVIIPPTCTVPGVIRYTAVFENPAFETQTLDLTDIPALGHTSGAVVTENHVDPSCTEPGSEDHVIYCSVCGDEISRETVELPAPGHTPGEAVTENHVDPTCTVPGSEDHVIYCTVCGDEISRETVEIPALGHTPGEPVIENRTEPSCTEPGSEDHVVYCTVCGEELSRETVELPALGHSAGEPVTENRVDPTCTVPGSEDHVIYCSVCGDEISRETVELPAPGHTPGEAVVTPISPSTCVTHGSEEHVICCSVCGEELSREIVELPLRDEADCPGHMFTDMPGRDHWAHEAIDWAIDNHVTAGTSPTTFDPELTVNRAQMVTFLWALNGKPEPSLTELPFTDVRTTAFYYKAVLWAVEKGITSGTTPTTFSPHDPCSRAQAVSFLWAAAGKPEPTLTENPFTDVRPTAYYSKAVLWAYEQGITEGSSESSFNPHGPCSRAQIVTFLFRAFGS